MSSRPYLRGQTAYVHSPGRNLRPCACVDRGGFLEEAIETANDSNFGLSASIYTQNVSAMLSFIRDMDAGLVRINAETAGVELQAPFGGMKMSSSHSRNRVKRRSSFHFHQNGLREVISCGGCHARTDYVDYGEKDSSGFDIIAHAPGAAGRLPLTDDLLRHAPSGDLFGMSQNVGMGWKPGD